jgi:lysozyme
MMKQLLTEWHKHILNEVKPQAKPQVKKPQAPTPGRVSYTYSPNLIAFLKEHEGFSEKPYQKKGDRPTIGYGTTFYIKNGKKIPVTLKDKPVTPQQAEQLMIDFLNKVVMPSLNNYLKNKPMEQNQIDALVSVMYNMGNSGFLNTELFNVASTNPKDPRVRDLFLSDKIATVGGKVSAGLKNRRRAEYSLYSSPELDYVSQQSNVPEETPKPAPVAQKVAQPQPTPTYSIFDRVFSKL